MPNDTTFTEAELSEIYSAVRYRSDDDSPLVMKLERMLRQARTAAHMGKQAIPTRQTFRARRAAALDQMARGIVAAEEKNR